MGDESFLSSTRGKVGAAALLILIVGVVVFVWQAVSASRALLDARERADRIQTLVRAGDFDQAARELDRLRARTHDAHDATDGILWDITRHIPYLGRNIGAVQTAAAALDTAAAENAPTALKLSRAVSQGRFRPDQGRFDLAAIQELTPGVRRAADSIDEAAADLDGVRAEKLLFPFNDLIGDLQDQIRDARGAANAAATGFELMPQMLGKDGPRNYLLMIQNPAELRSTGGLAGSVSILHADQGRVTMGWQGSAADINPFSSPVVQLSKDTLQQYGTTPASDFRDLNFSPDFPVAAQIARAMVARKQGTRVDGVVSIDPSALGYLMQGTGPVTASGVTLNAATVADTLLNQTYQRLPDQPSQDDFFEKAARAVFDAVMAGQGDQERAIKGLATGAGQHRVLVWSADPTEELALAGTAVAGQLNSTPEKTPEVGMYLNDSTAAKVDYYLDYRTSTSAVDCRNDDAQDWRTTVVFTSQVPKDYQGLSVWVLGNGDYAPRGTIQFNARFYAPRGGAITALTVDGAAHSVTADKHEGRQVALLPLALDPGQSVRVTVDVRTAPGQSADGRFSFTPGMVSEDNGVRVVSACG